VYIFIFIYNVYIVKRNLNIIPDFYQASGNPANFSHCRSIFDYQVYVRFGSPTTRVYIHVTAASPQKFIAANHFITQESRNKVKRIKVGLQ
jgi:hypothetical protein